jgi:hypothetical protein
MATKQMTLVALPYLAAGAILAAAVAGKITPELALALATMLALPSPVAHALAALKPPGPSADQSDDADAK